VKNYRADVDAALSDVDFDKNEYQIEFETNKGNILMNLFPHVAPGHSRNIVGLTKIGFYDGIKFHRVIKKFVIQVGCPLGTGTGGPGYQIDAEFNDIPHEPGILSMARTNDPNSAGSQFFLCTARNPHLDNQYTVFGKTADEESLKVVMQIEAGETDGNDSPLEDVVINKGTVHVSPKP